MNTTTSVDSKKTIHLLDYVIKYGVYTVFFIMVIVFSFTNSNFLTIDNFLLILQQAAPIGIAVIGITFVMIIAGIDISIGFNMYLCAVIIGKLTTELIPPEWFNSPLGYIMVYLISALIGSAIGLFNGIMIAKFKIVPFITTLAVAGIARGIGLITSNSQVYNLEKLSLLSNGNLYGIPYVVMIFVLLIVIFDYILRKTPYGRHLMAIGNDAVAAKKAGIQVDRNMIIAYIICGALAGFGGILLAGQVGSVTVSFAYGNEFTVISAAVLGGISLFGGKGNIFPGAMIGVLIVGTLMNGMAMMSASPYVFVIFKGAIIFIAVMMDSIKHKGELR